MKEIFNQITATIHSEYMSQGAGTIIMITSIAILLAVCWFTPTTKKAK